MKTTMNSKDLKKESVDSLDHTHTALLSIKDHIDGLLEEKSDSYEDFELDELEQLVDSFHNSIVDVREAIRSKGHRVTRDNKVKRSRSSNVKSGSKPAVSPETLRKTD